MKNEKVIWVVECKGRFDNWKPCLGFHLGLGTHVPGIYLTRSQARKASKKMFTNNCYNYVGKQFKPIAFYRVTKYIKQ